MLHVILHQLCQGGKLLPTVEVIVVSRVLDLNVGDGSISPATKKTNKQKKNLEKCSKTARCTSPMGELADLLHFRDSYMSLFTAEQMFF